MIVGSHYAARAPTGFLRTALGVVLVASGIVTVQKGDPDVWPIAAAVAGIGLGLLIWFPRWWNERRLTREAQEAKLAAPRPLRRFGARDDRLTD